MKQKQLQDILKIYKNKGMCHIHLYKESEWMQNKCVLFNSKCCDVHCTGKIALKKATELLRDLVIEGLPLALWLRELNRRICDKVGRDARNLQIGHSYFMEDGKVITDFYKFSKVIQEDIIPLIEEYCYNDYKTIAEIIGKGLVDEENKVIKHELFEPSRKSELISALIEPCPDIASSRIAQIDEQIENDDLESGDSES